MQHKTTRTNPVVVAILLMATFFYGLSVNAQLRQRVDSVTATLPARMWDGMSLQSVQFDAHQSVLTMKLEPIKLHRKTDPNSTSDMQAEGRHIVSDCVRAHCHAVRGATDIEGDATLWRAIGPMLQSVVSDSITLQLELREKKGHRHTVLLSSSDVRRAIELGKEKAAEDEAEAEEMKQGIYRVNKITNQTSKKV